MLNYEIPEYKMKEKLVFNKVPEKWEHYLPLGNGRLGAMVKTHPCNEIIQLNEEGIWSGGPQDRVNPDTQKYLNQIRKLVHEGKVMEAQELGFETISGTCVNERVYQTAGDFHIDFFSDKNRGLECGYPLQHKTSDKCLVSYHSELDIDESCTRVFYKDENGVEFERTSWISAVDDMLFINVKASEKGKINFMAYLDRGIWIDNIKIEDGFIFLEDSHGIPFCVGAGVSSSGGITETKGFCLTGNNCDEVLFYIDIRAWKWNKKGSDVTGFKKQIRKNTWSTKCKNNLLKMRETIEKYGVNVVSEDLFGWHLNEYKSYWDRFDLQIGTDTNYDESVTTPQLLLAADCDKTELINLYANFSRYLLISGSRVPGEMPLTLQGLWNCYMDPPWGSKYTININSEMNYWPVNMTGLDECELPLFELLERSYEKGCDVARRMYNCKGFVMHHNTDFWGDSAPQDAWLPGTYWVLGAAWLSTHIWEHFEYTCDDKFLKKYYYLMHESCQFFVDFLQPGDIIAPDGNPYLVISPSLSPENSYVTKAGQVGAFTEGCEMDNMILEHIFSSCVKAYRYCKDDCCDKKGNPYSEQDFKNFEYVLNHLKKPELNKDGSLMEWNTEVEEIELGHRHISHLYGLFPGHTITVERTPEYSEAAKKTLEKRLSNGGGHTGWSQAWIINFRTQLEQGNEALKALVTLLTHSTLPNLLDNHPPFQIDGNFGSLAAIIRMLVQSESQEDGSVKVKLLPALPDNEKWRNGFIKGVRIKGGYSLSFSWKNGKVEKYELSPAVERPYEKSLINIL